MSFEKYLRQKQIEKEATEAAYKSVNEVLSSSSMRSEFENWFKTTEAYKLIEEMNYFKVDLFKFKDHKSQYQHSAVQIAYMTYQHQQSKVDELQNNINLLTEALDIKEQLNQKLREREDELQRRNQMLNDNIKEQGKNLVYQNELIETQAEKLIGLRDEKAELQLLYMQQGVNMFKLQKRLDAALEVVKQGISKQGSNCYLENVEELLEGGGC